MKRLRIQTLLQTIVTLAICQLSGARAQTSGPPQVSIVWPTSPFQLSSMCIKLKAEATSPGASITNVEFFADQTNSLGAVGIPPFSHVWNGVLTNPVNRDFFALTAVARDSAGLNATSAPVTVYFVVGPPYAILAMNSPTSGAVFAASDTIQMGAELLASPCDTGPEEFFVGTNSVGIVNTNGANETFSDATPVFSLAVSNLAEGNYRLGVQYLGLGPCTCGSVDVRIVKLAAVSPRIAAGTDFQFDVVTSFAGKPNVIEVSTNLLNWMAISTNQPPTSIFTFTDTAPVADLTRFYRVLVPPR